jgi:hypothetical protein
MEMSGQLHASLPLGKGLPAPIGLEAGLASEAVWTLWKRENPLTPVGNRTPISQLVGIPTEPSRFTQRLRIFKENISNAEICNNGKVKGKLNTINKGFLNMYVYFKSQDIAYNL